MLPWDRSLHGALEILMQGAKVQVLLMTGEWHHVQLIVSVSVNWSRLDLYYLPVTVLFQQL